MNFEEYLASKKIDSVAFRRYEPDRFAEWETLFGQVHPESFTAQKKFLLNRLRRQYWLTPQTDPTATL